MRTKHIGKHWEVIGRDPRIKGEHRSYRGARKQEGAIHLHIRQQRGGKTVWAAFGKAVPIKGFGKPKRKSKRKKR